MHKIVKKIVEEIHLPGVIAIEAPLLSAIVGLATVPGVTPEVVDKWIEKAVAISDKVAGAPLTVEEHLLPIVEEASIVVGPAKAIIAAMPAVAKAVVAPKLPRVF